MFEEFKKDVEYTSDPNSKKYIAYTIVNEFMNDPQNTNIKDYLIKNVHHVYSVLTTGNHCNHQYTKRIYDYIVNNDFKVNNGVKSILDQIFLIGNDLEDKLKLIFIGYFINVIDSENSDTLDKLSYLNYSNITMLLNSDVSGLFNGKINYNIMFEILDYYLNHQNIFNSSIFNNLNLYNIDNASHVIIGRITGWYLPLTTGVFKDVNNHLTILNSLIYISSTYYKEKEFFSIDNNILLIPYGITVYSNIMVNSCVKYDSQINNDNIVDPKLAFHDFINSYEKNKNTVTIGHYANIYNLEYNDQSEEEKQYNVLNNRIREIVLKSQHY